jgi:hypothetical protein
VGQAFFPLDDELELLPGMLTPNLQEELVHLGTWLSFEVAAQHLRRFRQTDVARPTAERLTEAAGAAYVAVQQAAVAQIEREVPLPAGGPDKLFMSVDGAMVPLVGGEWAEVKTLVLGVVQPPTVVAGETVIRTAQHSYFSRLTDAATFQHLALVETQRRSVETAGQVGFVTDGSEWCQKFADHHRANAVRILDFPHAGEHLASIGQASFGAGSQAAQDWLAEQLHELKHHGPDKVVAEVQRLMADLPLGGELANHQAYLEKRLAQMQYPRFLAAGWPIGDGAVESANKLVVEDRLKGSGMHWARGHVDPMLALRNIACNQRWDEAWPQIAAKLRQQAKQRSAQRRHQRRTARQATTQLAPPPQPSPAQPPASVADTAGASTPERTAPRAPQPTDQPRRPPADHPWRRMPIGRARYKSPAKPDTAKP